MPPFLETNLKLWLGNQKREPSADQAHMKMWFFKNITYKPYLSNSQWNIMQNKARKRREKLHI